jgi:SAM-dependent methyltransferase
VEAPRGTEGWESIWADLDTLSLYWRTPEPTVLNWAKSFQESGGRRVLDLGCGVGRHTVSLARMGLAVTATDVSASGLATCAAQLAREKLDASLLCHEMETLPFPDNAFDGVVAFNVVYHATLAGMRRVLTELHRVLRPGGQLYITVIARSDSRIADYRVDIDAGRCIDVEPFTFVYLRDAPGDKYLPHHYCDESELRALMSDFRLDRLGLVSVEYVDEDDIVQVGAHYHVQACRW